MAVITALGDSNPIATPLLFFIHDRCQDCWPAAEQSLCQQGYSDNSILFSLCVMEAILISVSAIV